MFSFSLVVLFSCEDEEVCTDCVEAGTGVTSAFCDNDAGVVEVFENELINQGIAAGQSWSCVRK